MQLEVDFEPQTVGNHSERLIVHYDTGMPLFFGKSSTCYERLDGKHD